MSFKRFFRCALASLLLLEGCSSPPDASGTYIGKEDAGVTMLQLVQTPDGHLTGQFTAVVLDGLSGQIKDISAPVSGAINGQNISIQLRPGALLESSPTFAGSIGGSHLVLTGAPHGGAVSTMNLDKATVADFTAAADSLRSHANDLAQAAANAERGRRAAAAAAQEAADTQARHRRLLDMAATLVSRMQSFEENLKKQDPAMSKLETGYPAITAKMEERLERERTMTGNPAQFTLRGQLAYSIGQGEFATDQLHFRQDGFHNDFTSAASAIGDDVGAGLQSCHDAYLDPPIRPVAPDEKAACDSLRHESATFRASVDSAGARFVHLETAYRAESEKQKKIIAEANTLNR